MANASSNPHGRGRITVSEVVSKHLECLICYDTYDTSNPAKALPCQHTFCLNCINRLIQKKNLQCPHCKQIHKVPKKGPQDFNTCYQIMSLVEDFQNIKHEKEKIGTDDAMHAGETASSASASPENALCNVAIHQTDKLYNEAKDIKNRVDNVYEQAVREVKDSCSEAKNDVTVRLREIERLIHKKADDKANTETARILSQKEVATRGIKEVVGQCKKRLGNLHTSRQLPEDEWDDFNEQLRSLKDITSNISQNYHQLSYTTMALPKRNASDTIDDCHKLDDIHEEERVLVVYYSADSDRPAIPFNISRQPLRKHSSEKRNRREDREPVHVMVKTNSADSPNYHPRIILSEGLDSTTYDETNLQEPDIQTNQDVPPLPPKTTRNQDPSSHVPAEVIPRPDLPPLPPKASPNQGHIPSNPVADVYDPGQTLAGNENAEEQIGEFNYHAQGTSKPPPPLPVRKQNPLERAKHVNEY
ncbi:uncharacterized protein [Amphiura filiformis]|uniref:uncharacterized protein n=1 Tax=Amphiura filiformis TaxID=82378 RepID=UPI003B21746A